ncbi:capping complex subunit for YIEGIA, partial [Anaerospora hongkongensis]
MGREGAQQQTARIIAAVILKHHKVLAGDAFVLEAEDEAEQEQLTLDLAKAVKADVVRLSNG